jgi:hypothetical protein
LLGAYNSMGDSVDFSPGGSATPKDSRDLANIDFWNVTFQKP